MVVISINEQKIIFNEQSKIVCDGNEYDIFGVVLHEGPTVEGGHYISVVKKDEDWIIHNDDNQKIELDIIDFYDLIKDHFHDAMKNAFVPYLIWTQRMECIDENNDICVDISDDKSDEEKESADDGNISMAANDDAVGIIDDVQWLQMMLLIMMLMVKMKKKENKIKN